MQWTFKISVWVENTARGPRPSVFVQLIDPDAEGGGPGHDIMLFFGMELQARMFYSINFLSIDCNGGCSKDLRTLFRNDINGCRV